MRTQKIPQPCPRDNSVQNSSIFSELSTNRKKNPEKHEIRPAISLKTQIDPKNP